MHLVAKYCNNTEPRGITMRSVRVLVVRVTVRVILTRTSTVLDDCCTVQYGSENSGLQGRRGRVDRRLVTSTHLDCPTVPFVCVPVQ